MSKRASIAAWGLLMLATLAGSGCTTFGPNLGLFAFPIPLSPYFQDEQEDKFWVKERYDRVPVLGPIPADGPETAIDPPSDDEVMRALERAHPLEGWFAAAARSPAQ